MNSFRVSAVSVKFETQPDLFSPKSLDIGTELLLSCLSKFEYTTALDWGCGWGPIALWLAVHNHKAKITALDSDIAAVKMAQQNTKANELFNVQVLTSHGFDEVPKSHHYDMIVSNPPTHRGREVVEDMIGQSANYLNPNGILLLVVEARIKPWVARQMKANYVNYKIVKRSPKHVVVMAKNSL